MMIGFLLKLLVAASKDPDLRKFVTEVLIPALAKSLKDDLLPELAGMFPAFGAAVFKSAVSKIPGAQQVQASVSEIASGAIEEIRKDPDLPGISNVVDVSEVLSKVLSRWGF